MKTSSQRKTSLPAGRPPYRSLEGWALGVLIEQHAPLPSASTTVTAATAPTPTHGTEPARRLGGTRSRGQRRKPASRLWTRSCARSVIAARTAAQEFSGRLKSTEK